MRSLAIAALSCTVAWARAQTPIEAAVGLYSAKQYAEAVAAFEKIVAADPRSAAGCYYLGMSIQRRHDAHSLDDSVPWLEKAVALDPKNATYVGDYGGTCFLLADRDHSYRYAIRGRDSMIKAIALDPGDLPARDGLMQFYARAPWPLGSPDRALAQAEEIGRRNPARGVRAFLKLVQIFEKKDDRPAARDACKAALKLDPADATATAAMARLADPN